MYISKQKYDAMLNSLENYRSAAKRFIGKVESGQAKSRETYKQLKDAVLFHESNVNRTS